MSETHFVKVLDAIANLTKYAINLWTTHFTGHDDGEKVKRSEFHDLMQIKGFTKGIEWLLGSELGRNRGEGGKKTK